MEFNATFIVAFISFIVFMIIMNRILYRPILNIVTEREDYVNANLDEANKNSVKKDSLIKEKTDKIDKANNDAKNIISAKISKVNAKRDEITTNAKKEAQKNIDNCNAYYEIVKKDAQIALDREVIHLAQVISDKFLSPEEKITLDSGRENAESVHQG